jgi:farnesyl-diphosphate farnesyltransferase
MKATDLLRVDELYAMVQIKAQYGKLKLTFKDNQEDLRFCYHILQSVSRSFAAVIMQLNDELRDAVCIFYLVLRGLDTIEDDMEVDIPTKQRELPLFHEKLNDAKWCIDGIGKGDEKVLLQQFYRVSREYQLLKKEYQEVISDICHRMAMGMCRFLTSEVTTKSDYDLYCHYVAGLVGHGLTRLFSVSGLEDPHIADDLSIANEMGLFLQKTNIIRDYYEDICESPPRIFWPREIWSTFTDDLHKFKDPAHIDTALECLNALIADAMQHVPAVIQYMSMLKDRSVFLFCAIPQVMAIATLAKLYDNPHVFDDKVKIRKGLACKIMLQCDTLERALAQFNIHCQELRAALREEDPSFDLLRHRLQQADANLKQHAKLENASYARRFMTGYPALGGQYLYSLVDGISAYFRN